ncbi:glucokinase [Hyphomicrobium sp. xq]|uniref:Glucokinase n=1 Tax=Hyphomicrobium album TaxID=2665159 RepID=A0A6I3KCR3_9HYPH|nr:glucokinase [Hyphomicrobium album]MTD93255.1 glucokinase [Hyphomicrobium album]
MAIIERSLALVGDIGATNARFALVGPNGDIAHAATYLCEDHPSLADALAAYLRNHDGAKPLRAVLAVATSPQADQVSFTNNPWTFSVAALKTQLGLQRLAVINDFHANALAVPHLTGSDVRKVGGGEPDTDAPMGVIGPGSGLGVSAVAASNSGYVALPGEGGHVTMPAGNDEEAGVIALLRHRFDHVSAERVLSGPGLVNLYNALCELGGQPSAGFTAAQITDPKTMAEDTRASRAVSMFCAMLGTVAGNLALTLGARGGIYIAGGIVPKLGDAFTQSPFRDRFEDKGRFGPYLAAIPTYVVVRPHAALLGAAKLLDAN